ncbi:MAG: hydrogenase formation protein HypD [Bacillus sp. (in: Bacteria)]|nr:hydrogenase formation protein HypD [Bacillus sp. (in: firmicutes)]
MTGYNEGKISKVERESIIAQIHEMSQRFQEKYNRLPIVMEVCGSHTVALAKLGVKQRLHEAIRFIAGPGCPVCVTDQSTIDQMIQLAENPNTIICTFGDMMRVPGSKGNLSGKKEEGSDVRVVYSPMEAVNIAKDNQDKTVVMLGIGFETTIPAILAAVKRAEETNQENFKVLLSTKLIYPIMVALLEDPELAIDGFLLPGHVSMILGEKHFQFLEDYSKPGIISGFEIDDMLTSLYYFLEQLVNGEGEVMNNYKAIVTYDGNLPAQNIMKEMLEECDEAWRGIGVIPDSGFQFKEKYKHFAVDPALLGPVPKVKKTPCRCGEILTGKIQPADCPVFGKGCTPLHPIGPCMVSHEGSCAAAYEYDIKPLQNTP